MQAASPVRERRGWQEILRYRISHFAQTRLINPRVRPNAGNPGRRYALIETIGRRTGQPRQTPVGYGLQGQACWIVSEWGKQASYVQNLLANPRVRIKVEGAWRSGLAHIVPEDDPTERLKLLDPRTAAEIRRMGSSLLSIRVDLDR